MITTWADFVAAVKVAYWIGGEPSDAYKYRAIADLAHSIFVRQVESDLPLAKSFENSYNALKVSLAGSRIVATLPTTITAVKLLLPVDAVTDTNADGSTAILDNAIELARNDFNGMANFFDAHLINAAMDLQRHVPFYQGRNETIYTRDTDGISNQGFVTQVSLPADFRIQAVWAAKFHTALVEDVAFAEDDIVESNGRFYKVTTGGTLTTGQLGDGLTEQQAGIEETLGDMTFEYHCDLKAIPVRKFPWADREAIFSGRMSAGPLYTVSPQFDKLWLYPALVDGLQYFMLEWVGIKTSYEDTDAVTFDILAAQAAAQYIRTMLAKDAAGDGKTAAGALQMYQKLVRDAVIDNQARATGTTVTESELLAMNLGRVPWWRWALMNCTSSTGRLSNGNSEDDTANDSGTTNIVPTSANHVERIEFTGDAGDRFVVLKPTGPYANISLVNGSRVLVIGTFPADTVGINVSFRDKTADGTEMTSFSSDGSNLTIAMEFSWRSAAGEWELLRQQVPA